MKLQFNVKYITIIGLFLTGCSFKALNNSITSPFRSNYKQDVSITETLEISISCGREDINEYIEKGWTIVDKTESQVPCSWKTIKSSRNCNLKTDKGCGMTVPDQQGTKINYLLEKKALKDKIK